MADWQDGPEYAPRLRPAAFAAPVVAPLASAPPVVDPSAGAPRRPPTGYEVSAEAVPALASLVPTTGPTRNPQQPFDVVSAVVTTPSAWQSVHSVAGVASPPPPAVGAQPVWSPDQAIAPVYAPPPPMQGFPAPGTPQWFGPGADYQSSANQIPLTVANVVQAASYGLLITLVLSGIVSALAPIVIVVAYFLTTQVAYRRSWTRIGFYVSFGLITLFALPDLIAFDVTSAWGSAGVAAAVCSWLLIGFVLVLQYVGIRNGERPQL